MLDVLTAASCELGKRGLIHNPESLGRSAENPIVRRIQAGKSVRRDRQGRNAAKIERERSGLAHGRRSLGVDAVKAGWPWSSPRLAGRESHHDSAAERGAGAQGYVGHMAWAWPGRVLTRWEVAPNKVAGAVWISTQPRLA